MHPLSESEIRTNFSKNLSYIRRTRKHRLSQKALARRLCLSNYAVSMYESNRAAPTAYAVYQVSCYFGIPMERLLTKDLAKGESSCVQIIDC